jgi:hypothetical protein
MEGRTGQARNETKGTKGGQAVVETYPFTCPSTGEILHTIKPSFANTAAFINLIMEGWPDVDGLTVDELELLQAAVAGKLLDYFTRYYVKITDKQRLPGIKAVAEAYKATGLKKMPKGKELVGKIVLLAYARNQIDRRALLAHFSQLSGLTNFMNTTDQEATGKVLEA